MNFSNFLLATPLQFLKLSQPNIRWTKAMTRHVQTIHFFNPLQTIEHEYDGETSNTYTTHIHGINLESHKKKETNGFIYKNIRRRRAMHTLHRATANAD